MKNAITIHDVSERAGVSLSTVSRVLNDRSTVNPQLRERVLQAVQELDYRPNLAARTLKTSRSRLIVFMVPEISNPYYTETYRGIHGIAEEQGYITLVYEATDVREVLRTIMARGADGLIIDAFYCSDCKGELIDAGIPFVQTNAPVGRSSDKNTVRIDIFGATLKVIDYLRSMGHRKIGLIVSPVSREYPMDERERAFRASAADHGIDRPERFIVGAVAPQDKYRGGYEGMRELLARDVGVTAVIALNDLVAVGAIAGAESMGRRVPADLSIVGFDNGAIAPYTSPPLTTVNIPTIRQGEIAAKMLFEMMEEPQGVPHSVEVRTELIVRQSVRRCGEQPKNLDSMPKGA